MEFKPFKIGKYEIQKPIIQGGMGVGISWDQLAGNVSKEGALGVVSAVGTGVYKNRAYLELDEMRGDKRPYEAINFYSYKALKAIINKPLLYGGSVKPNNVKEIVSIDGVDGVLVGSASLDVESFASMINHK